MPNDLAEKWSKILLTYEPGQQWALWANEKNIVKICRYEGKNVWATPIGHTTTADLKKRGWTQVPTPREWLPGK